MQTFAANSHKEFSDVDQLYNWKQFCFDLLEFNGGDGLSRREEECLRGIALDLDRSQIAKRLEIQSSTVRSYLKKPYDLIKTFFGIEGRMTEKKARSLILSKYRRSKSINYTFIEDYKVDQSAILNNTKLINTIPWQTLDEIQSHIRKFHGFCEIEDYTEAFYTIDCENFVYQFLSFHGYLNVIVYLYEKLIELWVPRKSEK